MTAMRDEEQVTATVQIRPGGQITLPEAMREQLGMSDGSLVRLSIERGSLRLSLDQVGQDGEESDWFDAISRAYAPIRAQILARGLAPDETNECIDAAEAEAQGESSNGSPGLRALYEYFAPVREEILARGISAEEINADIDAAIAEVRAEQRARGE
jgi:hypothetical protein